MCIEWSGTKNHSVNSVRWQIMKSLYRTVLTLVILLSGKADFAASNPTPPPTASSDDPNILILRGISAANIQNPAEQSALKSAIEATTGQVSTIAQVSALDIPEMQFGIDVLNIEFGPWEHSHTVNDAWPNSAGYQSASSNAPKCNTDNGYMAQLNAHWGRTMSAGCLETSIDTRLRYCTTDKAHLLQVGTGGGCFNRHLHEYWVDFEAWEITWLKFKMGVFNDDSTSTEDVIIDVRSEGGEYYHPGDDEFGDPRCDVDNKCLLVRCISGSAHNCGNPNHAMSWNYNRLQPSDPLNTPADTADIIRVLLTRGADSLLYTFHIVRHAPGWTQPPTRYTPNGRRLLSDDGNGGGEQPNDPVHDTPLYETMSEEEALALCPTIRAEFVGAGNTPCVRTCALKWSVRKCGCSDAPLDNDPASYELCGTAARFGEVLPAEAGRGRRLLSQTTDGAMITYYGTSDAMLQLTDLQRQLYTYFDPLGYTVHATTPGPTTSPTNAPTEIPTEAPTMPQCTFDESSLPSGAMPSGCSNGGKLSIGATCTAVKPFYSCTTIQCSGDANGAVFDGSISCTKESSYDSGVGQAAFDAGTALKGLRGDIDDAKIASIRNAFTGRDKAATRPVFDFGNHLKDVVDGGADASAKLTARRTAVDMILKDIRATSDGNAQKSFRVTDKTQLGNDWSPKISRSNVEVFSASQDNPIDLAAFEVDGTAADFALYTPIADVAAEASLTLVDSGDTLKILNQGDGDGQLKFKVHSTGADSRNSFELEKRPGDSYYVDTDTTRTFFELDASGALISNGPEARDNAGLLAARRKMKELTDTATSGGLSIKDFSSKVEILTDKVDAKKAEAKPTFDLKVDGKSIVEDMLGGITEVKKKRKMLKNTMSLILKDLKAANSGTSKRFRIEDKADLRVGGAQPLWDANKVKKTKVEVVDAADTIDTKEFKAGGGSADYAIYVPIAEQGEKAQFTLTDDTLLEIENMGPDTYDADLDTFQIIKAGTEISGSYGSFKTGDIYECITPGYKMTIQLGSVVTDGPVSTDCDTADVTLPLDATLLSCSGAVAATTECAVTKVGHTCQSVTCDSTDTTFDITAPNCTMQSCTLSADMLPDGASYNCDGKGVNDIVMFGDKCAIDKNEHHICDEIDCQGSETWVPHNPNCTVNACAYHDNSMTPFRFSAPSNAGCHPDGLNADGTSCTDFVYNNPDAACNHCTRVCDLIYTCTGSTGVWTASGSVTSDLDQCETAPLQCEFVSVANLDSWFPYGHTYTLEGCGSSTHLMQSQSSCSLKRGGLVPKTCRSVSCDQSAGIPWAPLNAQDVVNMCDSCAYNDLVLDVSVQTADVTGNSNAGCTAGAYVDHQGECHYQRTNHTCSGKASCVGGVWSTDAECVLITQSPTTAPSAAPTHAPSAAPTDAPTGTPTSTPTASPTGTPTATPTDSPDSFLNTKMSRARDLGGLDDQTLAFLRNSSNLQLASSGSTEVPVFDASSLSTQFDGKTHAERALRRKHMMAVLMRDAAVDQGISRLRVAAPDLGFGSEFTRATADVVAVNHTVDAVDYLQANTHGDSGIYVPLDEIGEFVTFTMPQGATVTVTVVATGVDFFGGHGNPVARYRTEASGADPILSDASLQPASVTVQGYEFTLYFGSVTVTSVSQSASVSTSTDQIGGVNSGTASRAFSVLLLIISLTVPFLLQLIGTN